MRTNRIIRVFGVIMLILVVICLESMYVLGIVEHSMNTHTMRTTYADTTLWEDSESGDTIAPGVVVFRYHNDTEFPALVEKSGKIFFISPTGYPMAVRADSAGYSYWKCLDAPTDTLVVRKPYECPEPN